jgi:hypothetical protein
MLIRWLIRLYKLIIKSIEAHHVECELLGSISSKHVSPLIQDVHIQDYRTICLASMYQVAWVAQLVVMRTLSTISSVKHSACTNKMIGRKALRSSYFVQAFHVHEHRADRYRSQGGL